MKKKVKLYTHGADLDGEGCAILAKLAFGNDVEIEYCDHSDINQRVEEFIKNGAPADECYITDIRVSDELAKEINDKFDNFVLLDHHPTSLSLNQYDWCTVKIKKDYSNITTSGTEMYYQWLLSKNYLHRSDVLDRFVELVRNYDTWRWASLGEEGLICKQVNDLYHLYGREHFVRWCLTQIHDCVFPRLYVADEMVLDIKQREIDAYVEEKNQQISITSIGGRQCGVVFADKYLSELGNKLCQLNPHIDFIAMVDVGRKTVSYRTIREDLDLGVDIAPLYGGGGHPKAAGSQFSAEVKLNVIRDIFIR